MENNVLKYLETLPEPYRSQAIENYDPVVCEKRMRLYGLKSVSSVESALNYAFDWGKSPQGYGYWYDICWKLTIKQIQCTPL